jgi:pimeloyl-ACP methyl ester carboxylesterase
MSSQKSTNDRSSLVEPRQRAVRRLFGLLERVAPPVGAAWAERLWFTLPSVPEHARRPRVELPPGESFVVELDGRSIRGTVWGTGPAVYLVHGWAGWGLQLAAYAPPLVAAGFRVVAYDALSHGYSDPGRDGPRSTTLPEIAATLQAVVDRFGTPCAVIAHSIGAAATAHAMTIRLKPGRLVFIAAANTFDSSLDVFGEMLGIGPRIRRGLVRRTERRVGLPLKAFDVDGIGADLLAERGMLPPLLAIHDRDDRETPYEGSVAITEGWPDATLRPTDGLGHRQSLWHPALVAEVAAFVTGSATAREVPGIPGTSQDSAQDRMAG